MVEALRRLLWLVPLLGIGAIALFLALSQSPRVRVQQTLPLFYNRTPQTAHSESDKALTALLNGEADAGKRLSELGGAALPHILPKLPALPISDRRKLSQALIPLRHRLDDSSPVGLSALDGPLVRTPAADRELLYWERFHLEHDLDFRPINVARLARRLAERPLSLREDDLIVLDTYALPFLVAQIGRVAGPSDVERLGRLVPVISRASQIPYQLPPSASVERAREVATQIRRDWDRLGPKWTQLDRFETLAARLSQTEFAIWVFRTGRALTGQDTPVLARRLAEESGSSVVLLVFAAVGALVVGPVAASALLLLTMSSRTFWRRRREVRTGLGLLLCLLLPGALLHPPDGMAACALLTLVVAATSVAYLLHKELSDRLDWRSHQVLLSREPLLRISAVSRWLAPSIPTFAPIYVAEVFLWVTAIEMSSPLRGWGQATAEAYLAGDLEFLMATSLGLGLFTAALQLVADAALGTARWQRGES